jgi:hypothetical protein
VASTTAEMRTARKMPTAMAAAAMEMRATAMTTTTVTTTTMTTATVTAAAAFRRGISGGRQHGGENKDGKPEIEFRHGTLTRRRATKSRHGAVIEERKLDDMVPLLQRRNIRRARDKGLYRVQAYSVPPLPM